MRPNVLAVKSSCQSWLISPLFVSVPCQSFAGAFSPSLQCWFSSFGQEPPRTKLPEKNAKHIWSVPEENNIIQKIPAKVLNFECVFERQLTLN